MWQVETAKHHESQFALPLLDAARARGFQPETCAMDKGYDSRALHDGFEERDCHPIIAQIRARNAVTQDDVPTCEHGRWTFAVADFKNKRTKWRCPLAASANRGQLKLLACWIVIIVIVVLALLGFFGRGRFSR